MRPQPMFLVGVLSIAHLDLQVGSDANRGSARVWVRGLLDGHGDGPGPNILLLPVFGHFHSRRHHGHNLRPNLLLQKGLVRRAVRLDGVFSAVLPGDLYASVLPDGNDALRPAG